MRGRPRQAPDRSGMADVLLGPCAERDGNTVDPSTAHTGTSRRNRILRASSYYEGWPKGMARSLHPSRPADNDAPWPRERTTMRSWKSWLIGDRVSRRG